MSDTLDSLHLQFLKERRYLLNLSPRTLEWHAGVWRLFQKFATNSLGSGAFTQPALEAWVIEQRARGVTAPTVNSRLRSLNAFGRWMHEQQHAAARVRMKPLREPKRLVQTLTDEDVRRLVGFKPPAGEGQRAFALWRVWVMTLTALDTGCRCQELLDAKVGDLNLDDLLLRVVGKGDRERVIPFSRELRAILFRFLSSVSGSGSVRMRRGSSARIPRGSGTNTTPCMRSIGCSSGWGSGSSAITG
jgi:site-specific recombinase XerD